VLLVGVHFIGCTTYEDRNNQRAGWDLSSSYARGLRQGNQIQERHVLRDRNQNVSQSLVPPQGYVAGQFEVFRKQMTCVAGYYNEYFKFDGTVRIEAKSLAFGNMDEDEFRECYSALINAALKYIFKGTDDPQINNRLLGFF
jgi:hypothetical protein